MKSTEAEDKYIEYRGYICSGNTGLTYVHEYEPGDHLLRLRDIRGKKRKETSYMIMQDKTM